MLPKICRVESEKTFFPFDVEQSIVINIPNALFNIFNYYL